MTTAIDRALTEPGPWEVLRALHAIKEAVANVDRRLEMVETEVKGPAGPELLTPKAAGERFGLTSGQMAWRLRHRESNGLIESGAVVEGPIRINPERWMWWEQHKHRWPQSA